MNTEKKIEEAERLKKATGECKIPYRALTLPLRIFSIASGRISSNKHPFTG
jgi:hypothetical protein